MTPLASQSLTASPAPVETMSVTGAVAALTPAAAHAAVNDNAGAWKPNLLVQRRRRLTRRACRH